MQTSSPITPPPLILQPPSVLLEGASGSGKTSAIVTLLQAGLNVFVIGTEPGFVDSLIDRWHGLEVPLDRLQWLSVRPATEGWEACDEISNKIGSLDFEGMSK